MAEKKTTTETVFDAERLLRTAAVVYAEGVRNSNESAMVTEGKRKALRDAALHYADLATWVNENAELDE